MKGALSKEPCFLCHPDADLVYAESDAFFAMLGHGPIGEGYSLLATKAHCPSMLDVDHELVPELERFTATVRQILSPLYGPAVVTEHGRVAACVAPVVTTYEPHCMHAHRLVFPLRGGIGLAELPFLSEVEQFQGFSEAHARSKALGQYLYLEHPDGRCELAAYSPRLPRQILRALVASKLGEQEFVDWQSHPRLDIVAAAQRRLGLVE